VIFNKRKTDTDHAAASQKADDAISRLEQQEQGVNRLSRWLINRDGQNGFGEDIEFTLKPKGA
jgi:hypothetical protein